MSTTESVTREMTYIPVEHVDTEVEMELNDFTITGEYSNYDISEEEKETI